MAENSRPPRKQQGTDKSPVGGDVPKRPPYVRIAGWLAVAIQHGDLTWNDGAVHGMVGQWMNDKYNNVSWAGAEGLGDRLGLSHATVYRSLKRLTEWGFVYRKKRPGTTDLYRSVDMPGDWNVAWGEPPESVHHVAERWCVQLVEWGMDCPSDEVAQKARAAEGLVKKREQPDQKARAGSRKKRDDKPLIDKPLEQTPNPPTPSAEPVPPPATGEGEGETGEAVMTVAHILTKAGLDGGHRAAIVTIVADAIHAGHSPTDIARAALAGSFADSRNPVKVVEWRIGQMPPPAHTSPAQPAEAADVPPQPEEPLIDRDKLKAGLQAVRDQVFSPPIGEDGGGS